MKEKSKKKELQHPPYSRFQGYLKENGIKLKEIADLIGRTVPRISTNNNGFTDYKYDEVVQICEHLNISTDLFRPKDNSK